MVVQRQNPAYRLAPPTRRLMRRIPGAPGVGPVLKQLRNEKRPRLGPFFIAAELRAGPTPGALRGFQPAGKHPSVPAPKKVGGAGWLGVDARVRDTARGPNTWDLARLPTCWEASVCPHAERESGAQAGWVWTQVKHCARVQHPGPHSSSSLLGARRGT